MSDTIVVVDTGIDLNNIHLKRHQIDGVSICRSNNSEFKITTFLDDANCIQDSIGHALFAVFF